MSNPTKPHEVVLSPKQKEHLKKITEALQIDKITVSHSIEERTQDGRKTSAFYSVTASRGSGAELPRLGDSTQEAAGFTQNEARIARLILSKHVVASVYDDAIKRGVLPAASAQEEARNILTRYDGSITKLLTAVEGT